MNGESVGSLKVRGVGIIAGSVGLAALLMVGISLISGSAVYTVQESLNCGVSASLVYDRCPSGPSSPTGWYTIGFYDGQGTTIARLEVLFPSGVLQASNNSIPMMVAIWHVDGTWLDSLKLTFSTQTANVGPDVWFKSPEGAQSSQVLVYKDQDSAIVNVPNMGFMGAGSVTFNLLVQANRNLPTTQTYPLTVQAEIALHDSNYVFGDHSYTHSIGYPLVRHSFSGRGFMNFLIDNNGNVIGNVINPDSYYPFRLFLFPQPKAKPL